MALNASRHHRKNRVPKSFNGGAQLLCSTPRGITGKIAPDDLLHIFPLRNVLNASRHHRKNRK